MKKKTILTSLFCLLALSAVLIGCAKKNDQSTSQKTLTMVFYPNESAKNFNASRAEIQHQIEKATGKKVKIQTTTDYNVAIEAITSGKAQLAFMGPEGYVQANNRNKAVQPLVALSGASGTLKDASYRSYFMVPKDKAADYQKDGQYSIDNIKGKKISFVSVSSTSGYMIPARPSNNNSNSNRPMNYRKAAISSNPFYSVIRTKVRPSTSLKAMPMSPSSMISIRVLTSMSNKAAGLKSVQPSRSKPTPQHRSPMFAVLKVFRLPLIPSKMGPLSLTRKP